MEITTVLVGWVVAVAGVTVGWLLGMGTAARRRKGRH